jgi:hypothetical protein
MLDAIAGVTERQVTTKTVDRINLNIRYNWVLWSFYQATHPRPSIRGWSGLSIGQIVSGHRLQKWLDSNQ